MFGFAALVLGLDLLTKRIVERSLPVHGPSVDVLGEIVRWSHVKNSGSAFSLFQGGRIFFILFSIVSIIVIVWLASRPRYRSLGPSVCLGLILGGAVGNLVDRIAYGAVTDWIDVGVGGTRWPTFNVADIGVSLGVCLLFLLLVRGSQGQAREDGPPPTGVDGG
jgi:signal peptidase II